MADATYQASPIKRRRRRTKAEIAELEAQIYDALSDDHPQSTRHVFYLMTDPRLGVPVEKTDQGYDQIQDRIVKMRRAGQVPYEWIADMSRRGYFVSTFEDLTDFLCRMAGEYRADLWRGSDYYVEVWCESRSIASVILDDCQALAVSLYPAGGFTSISFARESALQINQHHRGRRVVVFYIGDYDPAGVLIDVAIERELRAHLTAGVNLDFRRLSITAEQVVEYDLPRKPRKAGERRLPEMLETVEAEAMPAHVLREMLRDNVEALLPPRALEVARIAEENEQEYLYALAKALHKERSGDEAD